MTSDMGATGACFTGGHADCASDRSGCWCDCHDDSVRGDGPCMDCGTINTPVWFTDNVFWNLVVGGPGTRDDPGGLLCPWCFTQRAHRSGLDITGWRLFPEFRQRYVGGDSA